MTKIVTILVAFLAIVSYASAIGKCDTVTIDDDGYRVYSCIEASFDDINDIPENAETIRISISKLSKLAAKAFAGFNLRRLSFYNCEIGHIDPDAFDGLEELEQLTFYGSNIYVLKASWFKDLSSLTHLILDQNDMVYIEPKVFSLIPNLEYLNIEDNNMNCLTSHALVPLKKLKYARIGKNPWLCVCYTELVEWMKNQQIEYEVGGVTESRLECMAEYDTELGGYEVQLDKNNNKDSSTSGSRYLTIGNDISILSQIPDNVQSIKFLDSPIFKVPRFAFFRFGNSLRNLELSNCSLNEIDTEAFAGLLKLERLTLFNNNINIVIAEWFKDLRNLKYMALNNNGIEYIQPSVFPLLDKLETLNLKKNDIGCFPLKAFNSMKKLKNINMANNTWICSCLRDFDNWLNQNNNNYNYLVLPTQCTDDKTHIIRRKYKSGYRNATFQQALNNEDAKIMSENFRILGRMTFTDEIPYGAGIIPIVAVSNKHRSGKVVQIEADHKRNKEITNYEYYRLLTEQKQHPYGDVIRAKYEGFEKIIKLQVPPGHSNFNIRANKMAQTFTRNNAVIKNSSEETSSLIDMKKSYVCVGGTIWDSLGISLHAEAIKFEKSVVPVIIEGFLSRFNAVKILEFINCRVSSIEPSAFKGLVNLKELVLDDNCITSVKSAWFEDIPDLERLSLKRNCVTKIENGVFELLPNLKYLGISGNQISWIPVEKLSYMTKLNTMGIGRHPCRCSCQMNLKKWLIDHKVNYDKDFSTEFNGFNKSWDCIKSYLNFRTSNNKNNNNRLPIGIGNSDKDLSLEESARIEPKKSTQRETKIRESNDVIENLQIEVDGSVSDMTTTNEPKTTTTTTTVKPEHLKGQCRFHRFPQLRESRWWCNGGDILSLDQIPSSAERIDITNANVPVIPTNAFVRFSNLTRLIFYNTSIRNIKPLAFAALNKLEWLIFLNNSIPVIRASWFLDLKNLTLLGLIRNSITEIEPDVFEHLPKLEQLSIVDNNLRCLYTESLSILKNLRNVKMQDNPWKWRCREELTQFFDSRNISYVISGNYSGKNVIAADLTP